VRRADRNAVALPRLARATVEEIFNQGKIIVSKVN
jgi:hypothetical protein